MTKHLISLILLLFVILLSAVSSNAFVSPLNERSQQLKRPGVAVFASTKSKSLNQDIQANLNILYRAAETKQEDSDVVFEALSSLEQQMREAAKKDPAVASETFRQLTGSWRLIFTTGTAKTQERNNGRRINYFPLKAIQSFDTTQDPARIENGIYFGDFCAVRFAGTFDFDMTKRRLNFDFDTIILFNGAWTIPLKQGQAASLGAKSGLGSESNLANAQKNRPAFFNWISADEKIATARGGGGGLALWKRIE